MADDNYIEIIARLNEVKSKNVIQDQLNKIQKQLQLQLSNIRITKAGQNALQHSIDSIQKNLQLNISGVNINQNQVVQQAQQVAQQISSSMNNALVGAGNTGGTTQSLRVMGTALQNLNNVVLTTDRSIDTLAPKIQEHFKQVGTATTRILNNSTGALREFEVEIKAFDGVTERLHYDLQSVTTGNNALWTMSRGSVTDNNIKLLEQQLRAVNTEFKTLSHNNTILGNLSTRKIFAENSSASEVKTLMASIDEATTKFKELQAEVKNNPLKVGLLGEINDLKNTIITTSNEARKLAQTLSQSTSNVIHEEEVHKLETLYNNIKASKVATSEFTSEYKALKHVLVEAQDTGDYTKYFNQLDVFKSKFAEAKSEVQATQNSVAELTRMAKQLSSNKISNFFNRNAGDTQVAALKTDIASLIAEWEQLNNEIKTTGTVTPQMQTKLNDLSERMKTATTSADKLQQSIKEVAQSTRLMAQRQSLDTRITTWMENNSAATDQTRAKLKALQAQIQSANTQTMQNLNNEFRKITSAAVQAGQAGMKFSDIIKEKVAKFSGWFSISTVVMRSVRYLREMVTTVRELDTAMTGLRKVTNETEQDYNNFFVTATKNAKELGASIKDIVDSTAEFARLGYSLKDASVLSEVATLYKNVGDGIDIGEATTSIISTMKGFGVEASEVESKIVDKFNKVGGRNLPMRNYIG